MTEFETYTAHPEPSFSRRAFLYAGTVLAVGASLLGCERTDGGPARVRTSETVAAPLPLGVYAEDWLEPHIDSDVNPGDVQTVYIAFGIPTVSGEISFEPPQPDSAMLEFIGHLGVNTEVVLSIGGWGDEEAPKSSETSRTSVLAGMKQALVDPDGFVSAVSLTRERLAAALGRPIDKIGVDVDFEYPTIEQTTGLTGLMQLLRQSLPKASLTMAVPSDSDNLAGYDIPRLAEIVDRLNVMTYANGADYGPDNVVADIQQNFTPYVKDSTKIAVGLSTHPEDPLLCTPEAMAQIHQKIKDRAIAVGGFFVWSADGLTAEHIAALRR
jgi:hypothetical protein